MHFIREVDGRILDEIKDELTRAYAKRIEKDQLLLPDEIKSIKSVLKDSELRFEFYTCVATWYVEAEIAVDIFKRIKLYQVMEQQASTG